MKKEKNLERKKHKFIFVYFIIEISKWRCPGGIWI